MSSETNAEKHIRTLTFRLPCPLEVDEDGDSIPFKKFNLVVSFAIKSTLSEVGLQLWPCSLLMCDVVASLKLENHSFVELGGGIGLVSLFITKLLKYKCIYTGKYILNV